MGKTKLTRKEILSKDPIRKSIVRIFGFLMRNRVKIGIAVIVVFLLAIGLGIWSHYRSP